MKNYYKKTMSMIFASVLSLSSFNMVFAQEVEEEHIQIGTTSIEFETSDVISDIGAASIKNKVMLDEEIFFLYPTFDDSELAMRKINEKNQLFLEVLQNEYDLNTMNQENWKEYRNAAYDYGKDFNVDSPFYSDYWSLLSFFDIYENEDQNIEILGLVNSIKDNSAGSKKSSDELLDLYFLLPYSNQLVEKIKSLSVEEVMPMSSNYDVERATRYARRHAEDYNSKYYKYPSDCTNFVSQILAYAGIPETNNWYWESATKNGCSRAWRIADNFCREFGIDYTNKTDFETFSKKLREGDVITYDLENDSDWEHVAYVTEVVIILMTLDLFI